MSRTLADTKLACELASRLDTVLNTRVNVLRFSQAGWLNASTSEPPTNLDSILLASLANFDKRSSLPMVLRKDGQLSVVVNTCPDAMLPIVVGLVLPDQPEAIVVSLISAHLEALQFQAEATNDFK